MKNNSGKPRLTSANRMHADYVAIAEKYPDAKDGIKLVKAVLDRANEKRTVVAFGSNAEATQRVVCALLSCKKPRQSLAKKALRYVALSNSAELSSKPISLEHLANLKANYVELRFTPTDADAPVSGPIVEETEETVTLKVGDNNQVFDKKEVITDWKFVGRENCIVDYEGGEIVCSVAPESLDTDGALSLDADEIVLNVDGSEVVMDTLDIRSWQCAAEGKRRVSPYKAVFMPDENGEVPPAENIPSERVGNAATRADVAFIDIGLHNELLQDKRAILVMPSFYELSAEDVQRSVLPAEALLVVLAGRVSTKEKSFLAQIRDFTQNIFFVQDGIDKSSGAEWGKVRRQNVRDLVKCLGQSREDIRNRYFPVSSAWKVHAEKTSVSYEGQQKALRASGFPPLIDKLLGSGDTQEHVIRRALELLHHEAKTLELILSRHHRESQWTDDLLKLFEKDLPEKHNNIRLQTDGAIRQMFGSHGIHPLVDKFLKEKNVHNMELKKLQDSADKLLEEFSEQILEKIKQIFGDHFKKLSALPGQLVNAAPPLPSTDADTHLRFLDDTVVKRSMEEAVAALSLQYKDEIAIASDLSATPGSLGQFLQSLMLPGLVVGGAFISTATATATATATGTVAAKAAAAGATAAFPVAVAVGLVLLVIALGALYYIRRETKRQQKEKNQKELKVLMTNLCNHLRDRSLRELTTVKTTYDSVIRKALDAYTDRFAESKPKQLDTDIQNTNKLLQDINKLLGAF